MKRTGGFLGVLERWDEGKHWMTRRFVVGLGNEELYRYAYALAEAETVSPPKYTWQKQKMCKTSTSSFLGPLFHRLVSMR